MIYNRGDGDTIGDLEKEDGTETHLLKDTRE